MRQVDVYISLERTIYENLAIEEYLMNKVLETEPVSAGETESEMILFLWSNTPCVVIGQNQNPWRECNLTQMEQEQVLLARRRSGGGAVYQDEGNLNYTFLCKEADYDREKQAQVIVSALRTNGILAEINGRNDLLLAGEHRGRGCKFSGMAFSQRGQVCLMHGTLMIQVNLEHMKRYLNVSKEKLVAKGIRSVESRVANVGKGTPDFWVEQIVDTLQREWGVQIHRRELPEMETMQEILDKYQSYDWKFGRKMSFDWKAEHRFDWGEIQLQFRIQNGRILEAAVATDALQGDWVVPLQEQLAGTRFQTEDILHAGETVLEHIGKQEWNDISTWLKSLI